MCIRDRYRYLSVCRRLLYRSPCYGTVDSGRWTSVSYTQLDVYKRQDLGPQFHSYQKYLKQVLSDRKKLFPITKATMPVSYTHLDVYKRQGLGVFNHRKEEILVNNLFTQYANLISDKNLSSTEAVSYTHLLWKNVEWSICMPSCSILPWKL